MPLTYRFYRSTVIGTGVRGDPFRSKLTNFIVADGSGANFQDWVHDGRPIRYALARCDSTVHAQIDTDTDIQALSDELPDEAAVNQWLDGRVNLTPAIATRLEADGCSVVWAAELTTKRDVLRYLSKLHVFSQELRRLGEANARQFLLENLDTRINQVPAAVRTRVQTWMQNRGLDTGWISGQTTVRQVVHFILENIQWPVLNLWIANLK